MTITSATGSLLFNFTTNGNTQVLTERLSSLLNDPTHIGGLLFLVYLLASFSQLVVGKLLDRVNLKKLYCWIVAIQIPILILATHSTGWYFYLLLVALMAFIFGAIPFTDAILAHYVNDSMRSRVMGMRLAVSFSISSIAVWLLGPLVKAGGFSSLFMIMTGIALITLMAISFLPSHHKH
jgi:MFS family permease